MHKDHWTPYEDNLIREAGLQSTAYGRGGRRGRLRAVAAKLGRTYEAVRKRASRIQARSSPAVTGRDHRKQLRHRRKIGELLN